MSIMVTGGTGFIGQRIVRKLVERGEEVVCFDLAPPRANMEPLLDRIKVYRGDMLQVPHLLEAINTHQVHKIIHMAALLPPDTEDRPHFGMQVNIQGTNNVFTVINGRKLLCRISRKSKDGKEDVEVELELLRVSVRAAD